MSEKNLIYSKRFPRLTAEELEEEMKQANTANYDDGLAEGESFVDYIEKNRKYVPNEKRIADKDKFIKVVTAFSQEYEVDADIYENEGYYSAYLYMLGASYNGFCKKLLDLIFVLADEFSFYQPKDKSCDIIFSFTYHTHDVYLKGRKITDL